MSPRSGCGGRAQRRGRLVVVEGNLLVPADLAYNGVMKPEVLGEPPFTDDAPGGPEDVFDGAQIDVIIDRIRHLNSTAEVDAAS